MSQPASTVVDEYAASLVKETRQRKVGMTIFVEPYGDRIEFGVNGSGVFLKQTLYDSTGQVAFVSPQLVEGLSPTDAKLLLHAWVYRNINRAPTKGDEGNPNPSEKALLDAICVIAEVRGWDYEKADGRGLAFGIALYPPTYDGRPETRMVYIASPNEWVAEVGHEGLPGWLFTVSSNDGDIQTHIYTRREQALDAALDIVADDYAPERLS